MFKMIFIKRTGPWIKTEKMVFVRYPDPLDGRLQYDGSPDTLAAVCACRPLFIWNADGKGGSEKTEVEALDKADQVLISQGWVLG